MITTIIIVAVICLGIGYAFGNSKRGFMVYKTNELPNSLFSVLFKNGECALLMEIGSQKRYFLITSEAFGRKPIRPKDTVKMMGDPKKMKELGIPVLGYPPLVKISEF